MTTDELHDICYECGGYGDDYCYNDETDELVNNCPDCWVTQMLEELDDQ